MGFTEAECRAMRRALALAAEPGVPLGPNPRVGCVLLDERGGTVAEGHHRGAGTAHAEVDALSRAGARARGTTAVVTLEPCNHTGRTGPCARALIEAGVRRVVFAQADPNAVASGGTATLRGAGVEVEPGLEREAAEIAHAVLTKLGVVGVLCTEFFVTRDGRLLINELAPRPHNSGHLTIDACVTSQFEQQLRAVCGLPLGSPGQLRPAAMANLLGDLWEAGEPDWAAALQQVAAAVVTSIEAGLMTEETAVAIIGQIAGRLGVEVDVEAELLQAWKERDERKADDLVEQPPAGELPAKEPGAPPIAAAAD